MRSTRPKSQPQMSPVDASDELYLRIATVEIEGLTLLNVVSGSFWIRGGASPEALHTNDVFSEERSGQRADESEKVGFRNLF